MFWIHLVTTLVITSRAYAEPSISNLHVQSTVVSQEHGVFRSPYTGQNSLSPIHDSQTSLTLTVFSGLRIWRGVELYVNPELAGGGGFDRTTGVAGFPNGEIYRVDDPSPKWNLARLYARQSIGFGGAEEQLKDDKNQLAGVTKTERLTWVIGKFALNDFFDNNSYSHDPRTQFLNWALMDHGAWDYAADTKGYSWGLYLEWNQPQWAIRFASVMVPVRANQMELDRDFPTARGDNLEIESRYSIAGRSGLARLLIFENHAQMGHYRKTIDTPSDKMDVTLSRSRSVKYGFGINAEQALTNDLGGFFRASWNDGHTETWNFTEIDRSLSLGLSLKGLRWNRENDNCGIAFIANGLSDDHRDYLAGGGYGFIVGDGQLHYAYEQIGEVYYLFKVKEGVDFTADLQYVKNPAYNSDRGPVTIAAMRLHVEM